MVFTWLMKIKNAVLSTWDDLRTSYWFLPFIFASSSILVSQALLSTDRFYGAQYPYLNEIFYTGSAEGARLILSTIAGSMIGIAGVVFSITMVTLALASKQFGPRLLRNFMRDRLNQIVLGTFVSTFIFCILVLRELHGQDGDNYNKFIPQLSMMASVLLAGASIAVLIYYIHHIATSIQAPLIISKLRKEFVQGIGNLYPAAEDDSDLVKEENLEIEFNDLHRGRELVKVYSSDGGYVRRLDEDLLIEVASKEDLILIANTQPGDFVMKGEIIIEVWAKVSLEKNTLDNIESIVSFGPERTQEQDIRFTMDQIVGICLMALSPSVNDPFTARQCIDALGDGLAYFGQRQLPSPYLRDEKGVLRAKVIRIGFAEVMANSLDEIRLNSVHQIGVANYIVVVLLRVARLGMKEVNLNILKFKAQLVFDQIKHEATNDYDRSTAKKLIEELNKL